MKNECSIVCDLLPLYAEDMVSEDTAEFVKEHLGNCPTCRAELEKLRKPVQPVAAQHVPDIDAEPLKRLKKALLMEKVQAILCTAAVLLALMLSGLSFLTAPEYFAYSQELVTVTEGANGEATISFSSEITNYKLQRIADPADKQTVYHLEVWTCAWDRMFSKPGAQDVTVKPENGHELLIYFTQFINQSSSNSAVCIYGEIFHTPEQSMRRSADPGRNLRRGRRCQTLRTDRRSSLRDCQKQLRHRPPRTLPKAAPAQ